MATVGGGAAYQKLQVPQDGISQAMQFWGNKEAGRRADEKLADERAGIRKKKEVKEFAELELLPSYAVRSIAKKKGLEEKARMTKAGLIKPVWVLHQLKSRAEAVRYATMMGYKPGWVWYATKTYKNLPWLRVRQETE